MFLSHYDSMINPNQHRHREKYLHERRAIFAKNLKQARKETQISQIKLAELTGLTQKYISEVETTKSNISMDKANIIAMAVGRTLVQLLTPAEK